MEKVCEFCRGVRPVVYCQADAAHLCLSCDARVHSANALSNRHLRSLLCDSCRFRPASFHCSEHNIYTCRSCDKALHCSLQQHHQHQRRPINSYIGCPSAKDFAALWNLDLNDFRELANSNNNASSSSIMSCTTSVRLGIPNAAGSTKQQQQKTTTKIPGKRQQLQATTRFIMQQIVDLKKLQLNDQGNGNGSSIQQLYSSPLVHGKEDNSSARGRLRKIEETTMDGNQDTNLHPNGNNLLEEIKGEPFPSTFTLESSMDGEAFWQCRSPFLTNQFSAQNMQDLGVCEDLSRGDFNIPDVDVTFQNYEELFGGEQGLPSKSNDIISCSSDKSIIRAIQDATASAATSSMYMRSDHFGPSSQSVDIARRSTATPIQPSYSSLSISQDHEHEDAAGGGAFTLNACGDATKGYKDKKKSRLLEKKTQHALTSSSSVENADVRKRAVEGEVRMQRFRYY